MTLTVFLFFVPVLVGILLALNYLIAVQNPDMAKATPFECGIRPLTGQTRAPFSILYYLVAILFLTFDLEILMIYPLVTILGQGLGIYGYTMAILFFSILTLGFVIELAYGVLSFSPSSTSSTSPSPSNKA